MNTTINLKVTYKELLLVIAKSFLTMTNGKMSITQFQKNTFDLFEYPKSFFQKVDSDMFNEQYKLMLRNIATQYDAMINEFHNNHKRMPTLQEFLPTIEQIACLIFSQSRTLIILHLNFIESRYAPLPKEY